MAKDAKLLNKKCHTKQNAPSDETLELGELLHECLFGCPSVLLDARLRGHLRHDETIHPFDGVGDVALLGQLCWWIV